MDRPPFPIVPQRSGNDCMVAAFATVVGRTYEDAADMLGVRLDPITNAVEPGQHGVPFYKMAPASLKLGLSATTVFCATPHMPETQSGMLEGISPKELRALIDGRNAVLGVPAFRDGQFEAHHAVAWKDGHLVDCGNRVRPGTSIEDAGVYVAVIIAPLPPPPSRATTDAELPHEEGPLPDEERPLPDAWREVDRAGL